MFERPNRGENALLVHVNFSNSVDEEILEEFQYLAISAGAEILHFEKAKRDAPHSKFFMGKGKVEEIKSLVKELGIDLVICNHALSPAQERNLEREFQCRVLDRTGLILDIFAQRARTYEGKLQVELAQCRHLATRLVRGWTHLERQKGGIGLRGPGETQLETDRRLLRVRINHIEKRLQKVKNQRAQGRSLRLKKGIPVVALVGYTNAGKSTLFNLVTESEVYVEDQLFATLDPTIRQAIVPQVGPTIFADTVGFIRDLPHELVAAFSATLEETKLADLLLHVIDYSDPGYEDKMQSVREVLHEIGADQVPELIVFNKIDETEVTPKWVYKAPSSKVYLSAKDNQGITELEEALAHSLAGKIIVTKLKLGQDLAKIQAELHELGVVNHVEYTEDGCTVVSISIAKKELEILFQKQSLNWQDYQY